MSRSESVSELSSEINHGLSSLRSRSSLVKDIEGTPPKSFGGLGKSLRFWWRINRFRIADRRVECNKNSFMGFLCYNIKFFGNYVH